MVLQIQGIAFANVIPLIAGKINLEEGNTMNRKFFGHARSVLTFCSGIIKKVFEFRRIISEFAVVTTLILAWFQLQDIAQANTITAEQYILAYEKEHLHKWEKIDDLVDKIEREFEEKHGTIGLSNNKEKIDNHLAKLDKEIIEKILSAKGGVKHDIDMLGFHFRSAIFCVADGGRCDKERVIEYYKPHICSFVQKTYAYVVHMYDEKKRWNRGRGDLIAFNNDYECAKVDGKA